MLDVSYLKGSSVRDRAGGMGRIQAAAPWGLTIGWEIPHTPAVREERLRESDARLSSGIEIWTLNAGWQSLGSVLGLSSEPQVSTLSERAQLLIAELKGFLNEWEPSPLGSSQNPFKRRKHLGPGPKGETLRQQQKWQCGGMDYTYTCVGIAPETKGRRFTFTVDRAKKSRYNKEYKRWRRLKHERER